MQYIGKHDDEFFAGNTSMGEMPDYLRCLGNSARLGNVALDIEGKRLPANYRPIFVKHSAADAHDRIMVARCAQI